MDLQLRTQYPSWCPLLHCMCLGNCVEAIMCVSVVNRSWWGWGVGGKVTPFQSPTVHHTHAHTHTLRTACLPLLSDWWDHCHNVPQELIIGFASSPTRHHALTVCETSISLSQSQLCHTGHSSTVVMLNVGE